MSGRSSNMASRRRFARAMGREEKASKFSVMRAKWDGGRCTVTWLGTHLEEEGTGAHSRLHGLKTERVRRQSPQRATMGG